FLLFSVSLTDLPPKRGGLAYMASHLFPTTLLAVGMGRLVEAGGQVLFNSGYWKGIEAFKALLLSIFSRKLF
ncbi:MAG: hypothetical protein QF732_09535, partial [Nitrospinaceae bacterium]|nr:hypothetical protein [Nitrospinaceae bacterium]